MKPCDKVFGIGLNKTGTTTLGTCGKILGYRCLSVSSKLLKEIVDQESYTGVTRAVEEYDFFEDWPWPLIYQYLDKHYPGAKFILTTRKDETTWLNSLINHSMRTNPFRHCRKHAYGYYYPHYKKQEHIAIYLKHNDNVQNYFQKRPAQFLELCWENGDGWEELCGFLGKPVPNQPFPHENSHQKRKTQVTREIINTILCRLVRF